MTDQKTSRRGRPAKLTLTQASNRTVLIGIELLKIVVRSRKSLSLTEIARQTSMSPGRTHRYVASLCQAGFLRQDPDTKRYGVGPGAIELGISATAHIDGIKLATETMELLTEKTGLVSYLCVWGSNGPTVIKSEFGDVQTAVRVREGSNLSMLTATGHIFLSYLPNSETEKLVKHDLTTWNDEAPRGREVSLGDLEKICQKVRASQLARTMGMRNANWTAFSAPVFGPDGKLIMALTVIGISDLFDTRLNGSIAIQIKDAARVLSISLGASIT